MKIAMSCYPTYGGSGVIASELGIKLAEKGHEIHFISYSLPFRLQKYRRNIFFHKVEVPKYPLFEYPPYALALTAKMVEVVEKERIDLFHVHYAIPHAISAYLAKEILGLKFPKIITTLHGTDITLVGNKPSLYKITQFSIEQSDYITAVSHSLRDKTMEEFNIEKPIEVLPNFVDTERFIPKINGEMREKFATSKEKILMHISNFRPNKRIKDVILIFNRIRTYIPAKLLMIGDGPEKHSAQKLAKELNIDKDILFWGKYEEIEDLLPFADLFLLPSEQESFGLVAVEAMSCGVPVIATLVGGLPEVVDSGKTGFLEGVGDINKMAERALDLFLNDALMKKMKLCCRERAIKKFSANQIVPMYQKYYERVLKESTNSYSVTESFIRN